VQVGMICCRGVVWEHDQVRGVCDPWSEPSRQLCLVIRVLPSLQTCRSLVWQATTATQQGSVHAPTWESGCRGSSATGPAPCACPPWQEPSRAAGQQPLQLGAHVPQQVASRQQQRGGQVVGAAGGQGLLGGQGQGALAAQGLSRAVCVRGAGGEGDKKGGMSTQCDDWQN
jgi:hypothetical protein